MCSLLTGFLILTKTAETAMCFFIARISAPSEHQCHAKHTDCFLPYEIFLVLYIKPLLRLRSGKNCQHYFIFSECAFFIDFRRRSYMIGTFTKNLTKGCGINE